MATSGEVCASAEMNALGVELAGGGAGGEGLDGGFNLLEGRGLRLRGFDGDAALPDPLVDPKPCRQLFVPCEQVGAHQLGESAGGHGLEGVDFEVTAQEAIEGLAPHRLLQEVQEEVALLVGSGAQLLVGVAPCEGDVERGVELLARRLIGDFLLELPFAEGRVHLDHLAVFDRLHDAALEVGREPLVEPEIVPGGVGHQVARPGVGELVGHRRDQRPVAGDQHRGQKGQVRVLHAAEWEARRHHQQVEALPVIGPVELLGDRHRAVRFGEFPGRRLDHAGLSVDAAAVADRPMLEVADRQRQQVRRHRLRHGVLVDAVRAQGLGIGGAHQRQQIGRHPDAGVVGDADSGGVLAGHPGACHDRLRLGVEERLAGGGLLAAQPLQGTGVVAGGIVDHHPLGVGREIHRQRPAEERHLLAQGPASSAPPVPS